jgi:hypothetical protein
MTVRQMLIALLLSPIIASGAARGAVGDAAFEEYFQSYYSTLAGFGSEDLRRELGETIEDALITGGHLSQSSLDYRIRRIEQAIFSQLREMRCPPARTPAKGLEDLKRLASDSVAHAAEASKENIDLEERGMISGVLVRLIQAMTPRQLCAER